MRNAYRLKHKPTGLYWVKKSYNHLSETGSVFTSGVHSFSGLRPEHILVVRLSDDRMIRRHLDVLSKVGILETHPEQKWDSKNCRLYNTGKTLYSWHMKSTVADFEKEYVPLTDVSKDQELIKKVADICWNHRENPDIETFDEWMDLIQSELKQ